MPTWRVPMVDLRAQHAAIGADLQAAAMAVVERQAFILGEPVARFERTLEALSGTTHAIGVASGSDALALALRAVGVGPGDGVVTSAFGFVATAEAIVRVGARPIFADVDEYNLAPASVEEALARAHPRAPARAILPAHLFGACAPMGELVGIARRHALAVVEDAAQAILATSAAPSGARGRAGSLGDAGALSFFPSKNLGGWGDGGAVVTSRQDVADRVRALRVHGSPAFDVVGTNSRLDALQAAVLGAKVPYLEGWTAARVRVADRYRDLLAPLGERVLLPRASEGHVYNQFVLRVERRDALLEHLARHGIEARAYYPRALHELPAFAAFADGMHHPRAEGAARTAVGIPIYPELSEAQQAEVADAIAAFAW